jgi:hypothetical protein
MYTFITRPFRVDGAADIGGMSIVDTGGIPDKIFGHWSTVIS